MTRARRHALAHAAGSIRGQRARAAALVILVVTLGVACSPDAGAKTKSSATPSRTKPTLSREEEQARRDVVAAYQRMTDERVKAYSKASLAGSRITDYATGAALRDVKDAIFVNMRNDIIVTGQPKVIVDDDDVSLGAGGDSADSASLRVCFDTNTWKPIDKKTGKSVAPPHQVKRYVITAQLQRQSNRWRVTDEKADKEKPC